MFLLKKNTQDRFQKEESMTTTLLIGGLTFQHETLVRAAFEGTNYFLEILPTPSICSYQTGKEYGNKGQCNPAYFTVGNLIQYLQNLESKGMSREEIIKNYVFFTAGGCGPCRFGMYESEYRLALRNSGFDEFRVIIFDQAGGLDQKKLHNDLGKNVNFFANLVASLMIGDLLKQVANSIRPYEIYQGETDEVLAEAIELMSKVVCKHTRNTHNSIIKNGFTFVNKIKILFGGILNREFKKTLHKISQMFDQIECDFTRVKPIVKVIGEFWAQTTEGEGNFNMFQFLQQEGAEIDIEPIMTWLNYLLWVEKRNNYERRGFDKKNKTLITKRTISDLIYTRCQHYLTQLRIHIGTKLFNLQYNFFRKALGSTIPPLVCEEFLAKLAHPYINFRASGGKGHLEVAKNIYYTENNLCHMVLSLKPFGCMPSTQSDGVQTKLQSRLKNGIYLSIETSGEGEINAQSRVQMALADAKIKVQEEMNYTLKKYNLNLNDVQNFVVHNKTFCRGLLKIPYVNDIAGKSARFVKLIAKAIGKKNQTSQKLEMHRRSFFCIVLHHKDDVKNSNQRKDNRIIFTKISYIIYKLMCFYN